MVPESDKHSLGTLSAEGKAVTQVSITVHKQSLGLEIMYKGKSRHDFVSF